MTDETLEKNVRGMWEAFVLLTKNEPVAIQMQPDEEKKSVVGRVTDAITGAERRHLKIAFVHDKDRYTSGWTYAHELGKEDLQKTFGDQLEIVTVDNIFNRDQTPEEVLKELAESGCNCVFTTTPRLIHETQKAAVEYPDTKFLNCSLNMAFSHIRTYYGRMYEAKFLCGLIAGVMTEKNVIAYVADYPIAGVISSINAFARGVELVNPKAKIKLYWSTRKGIDIPEELQKSGADLVSSQDMLTPGTALRNFGLYRLDEIRGEDGETSFEAGDELALPLWNWGKFYERIIRSILSGSWNELSNLDEAHAVNYWWGLASGVIDIAVSDDLPEGIKTMTGFYKKAIMRRSFAPFEGYLTDQAGNHRSESDGYIATADIVKMDWLLDNIIGEIPDNETLGDAARNLVETTDEGNTSEGVKILKSQIERS